jgi:hypothetical protein
VHTATLASQCVHTCMHAQRLEKYERLLGMGGRVRRTGMPGWLHCKKKTPPHTRAPPPPTHTYQHPPHTRRLLLTLIPRHAAVHSPVAHPAQRAAAGHPLRLLQPHAALQAFAARPTAAAALAAGSPGGVTGQPDGGVGPEGVVGGGIREGGVVGRDEQPQRLGAGGGALQRMHKMKEVE